MLYKRLSICSWELILLGTGALPPIQFILWVLDNFILTVPDAAGRSLSAGPWALWYSLCSAALTALFTFLRVLSPTPGVLASLQLPMLQLDPLCSLP